MARVNQYIVRGFKKIEYIKRTTGDMVSGTEVYLEAVTPDDDVTGVQLEAVYLNSKYATLNPALDIYVRKVYNQYGKVEDLIEV